MSFLIRFAGTVVSGLKPGAAVEVQGHGIGDVRSVGLEYAPDRNSFVAPGVIDLQPRIAPARPRCRGVALDVERHTTASPPSSSVSESCARSPLCTGVSRPPYRFLGVRGCGPKAGNRLNRQWAAQPAEPPATGQPAVSERGAGKPPRSGRSGRRILSFHAHEPR